MLHDWNFKTSNPIFSFEDLVFSFEIFTDSNRYDLDAKKCKTVINNGSFILDCEGLEWAGGQEKCAGSCQVEIKKVENFYTIDASAKHFEKIRRLKVKLYNQPTGKISGRRRYDSEVSEAGEIFRYPNGWDDLFTPLITISSESKVSFYRSLDTVVRPKTFMVQKQTDGAIVEMIFEEDSRHLSKEIVVPTWEVGTVDSVEEIFEKQRVYLEKAYGLMPWETRPDVADWMRKISLVISLHGMHWSGYIFNTYQQMKEKLAWFAKYINPENVLVYIPGFDGRYYYKYSNYSPDERMGGKAALKELIEFCHQVGYHVIPMFMINGANPNTEGFETWGKPSMYRTPNGFIRGVSSCDWDTSRGYDLGCGVGLNPGAPLWQDVLVNEIIRLVDEFNFDGVFLDLAAIYINDPVHSTHEGTIQVINRLHEKHPNLLISTEGWYDALTPYFPFSQCAGEPRTGEMIWHDTPYPKFFDQYNRAFGHLCLGDPASKRNGVFEWGINHSDHHLPLRKGIIPTVTILEDTIDLGKEKILEIINDAKTYKERF